MATFATRVRELRKRKRLTQNQLANELGVSMQTISLWERGPRKPDFEMLDRLTEYFEVRMEFLLGSSDDDTPRKQPTEEEIKSYLQENKVARPHGRPSPHIRCAYLALRRTGPGGRTPKIVKVKSAFVNKDLLTSVPQGFYKND